MHPTPPLSAARILRSASRVHCACGLGVQPGVVLSPRGPEIRELVELSVQVAHPAHEFPVDHWRSDWTMPMT